jgi:four helix bundle protein
MATIGKFEDILAWQRGRELTRHVYRVSRCGEFGQDFVLRDQIRRAAVSITSNIAEGFERSGRKEFVQFLALAKGSCGELRSQLYVALDEGYLSSEHWQTIHDLAVEVSRLLDGFMQYLRQTDVGGRKYAPSSSPKATNSSQENRAPAKLKSKSL